MSTVFGGVQIHPSNTSLLPTQTGLLGDTVFVSSLGRQQVGSLVDWLVLQISQAQTGATGSFFAQDKHLSQEIAFVKTDGSKADGMKHQKTPRLPSLHKCCLMEMVAVIPAIKVEAQNQPQSACQ